MPDQVSDIVRAVQLSRDIFFVFKFEKRCRELELLSYVGFLLTKAYLTKNPCLNISFQEARGSWQQLLFPGVKLVIGTFWNMWFASTVPILLFLRSPISLLVFIFLLCSYVAVYMKSVLSVYMKCSIFPIYLFPFSLQKFFFLMTSSHLSYKLRGEEVIYLNQVSLLKRELLYELSGLFDYLLYCLLAPPPEKWGRERNTFHFLFLLLIDSRKLLGKKSKANY